MLYHKCGVAWETTALYGDYGLWFVVFSPDGKYLAYYTSYNRIVKLWKSSDGSLVHTLSGHQDGVNRVVFSPDGKYLASASSDETVKLWNLNIEDLLLRACKGVRSYLKNRPEDDRHKHLCDDIDTEKQ